MDRDTIWRHIHAERAALAGTLAALSDEQWEHETLCAGWRVHDLAAHVISVPQTGWSQFCGIALRNLGRGFNTMIDRETRRLGRRETRESILADFERYAGSRRKVPVTTIREPLIDALVHHQDAIRPLGLSHDMAPDAAAEAADRIRVYPFVFGTRGLVKGTRMVATDIDWVRGEGPAIEGPMQELLMLLAGRPPYRSELSGDGLALMASPA